MGQLQAIEMAEGVATLREVLELHPPVDTCWVAICVSIIERYNGGDHDVSYLVERPDRKESGSTWNAQYIIQRFRLEAFLEDAG